MSMEDSWDKMWERIENWLDLFVVNLPNILLAFVVFTATYALSRFLNAALKRTLKKWITQTAFRELIANISSIFIIGIGLFLAMSVMNLDTMLKSLLAGAGVAGLAIGLALQGILSNTFSGVFLAVKDIIHVGDFVETNGYLGTVEKIDLRSTMLKAVDNNVVVIPNKMVLENPFKNYGLTAKMRVIVECGVGYESDLQQVKEIASRAIEKIFPQEEGDEIEFYFTEFGDSSINFQLRFWTYAISKVKMLEAKSDAIQEIKRVFDEHEINIPFPIRTLELNTVPSELIS